MDFADVDLNGIWNLWKGRADNLIPLEARILGLEQSLTGQVMNWNDTPEVSTFDYRSLFDAGEFWSSEPTETGGQRERRRLFLLWLCIIANGFLIVYGAY